MNENPSKGDPWVSHYPDPGIKCTDCGATLPEPGGRRGDPCGICGSRNRTISVPLIGSASSILAPTIILIDGPVPAQAKVAEQRRARLEALIKVCEQVAEDMDDDGKIAIVLSERLQRMLGFARRDRQDLEQGKL